MQIWAESGKSAPPICNYSQILYQFLAFTQNLKRSLNLEEIFYFCNKKCRIYAAFGVSQTHNNTYFTKGAL